MTTTWTRPARLVSILPVIAFLSVVSCSDDTDPRGESACAGAGGPCAEGPAPPTEVVTTLVDCLIHLTWSPVEGATHYRIYRDDEARSLDCVPANVLEWTDPYPSEGFARYQVASIDVTGAEACQEGMKSAATAPLVAGPCPLPAGFVYIPPGIFHTGTPPIEGALPGPEPPRTITLTRGFFLARHEVTQAEWRDIMGSNPSFFAGDEQRPVEEINWFEAIRYCNARSVREGLEPCYELQGDELEPEVTWRLQANGYRLPTEAEWEYACRAGSRTDIANGDLRAFDCAPRDPNLDLMGWFCGNSNDTTHPVRQKQPNAWGLYDMHGNVAEWCWDRFAPIDDVTVDPRGADSGYDRVRRGGAWNSTAWHCRSAYRNFPIGANARSFSIGLRVARTAD